MCIWEALPELEFKNSFGVGEILDLVTDLLDHNVFSKDLKPNHINCLWEAHEHFFGITRPRNVAKAMDIYKYEAEVKLNPNA